MASKGKGWKWEIDLQGMVGSFAHLETGDGSYREGKITAVSTHEVKIDDVVFDLPIGLELNGDQSDVIELRRIVKLELS